MRHRRPVALIAAVAALAVTAAWLARRRQASTSEAEEVTPLTTTPQVEPERAIRTPPVPPRKRVVVRRLRERLDVAPFSLFIAAIFKVPGGILAAIYGSRTSAAITAVLPGAVIPHLWGGLLVISGAMTILGIARGNWLLEFAGLRLGSAAVFFYAACLFLGLGLRGVEAGLLCTAVGLAKLYRARYLRHTTRTYRMDVADASG